MHDAPFGGERADRRGSGRIRRIEPDEARSAVGDAALPWPERASGRKPST
jgi:hypothetical protein